LAVAWHRKPWVLLRKWGLLVFKGQFVPEIETTINSINRDPVLHEMYKPFKRPPKTVMCEMIML
jgi:hypothetical protein